MPSFITAADIFNDVAVDIDLAPPLCCLCL